MEFSVVKNTKGFKSIDFGKDRSNTGFYQLAKKLESILSINYYNKRDNFSALTWSYSYQGVLFNLCYHWDTGTTLQINNTTPSAFEEEILDGIVAALLPYS